MQNRCNCGCDQNFVPVSSNWDFNMNDNCDCQQGYARRNRRNACDECEKTYARTRSNDNDWKSGFDCQSGSDRQSGSDCQCERCGDSREVACCEQNTYIRDMDEDNCGCTRNRSGCSGKSDCQCEACARGRRSNDCDKDRDCNGEAAYARTRSNCCGCDKDDSAYNRTRSNCGCKDQEQYSSRKNRTVGMINVEMQEIDQIFESESALRAGTLFPELHKPMNGYCPCDKNCGTCKQQAAFAAWEMRLYLNTHPNDKEAHALFRKLCKEAGDENYATTFLTDDCCASSWKWVKNPWPWEYDCQCEK